MHKRLSWLVAAVLLFTSASIQPASAARPFAETLCVDPDDASCAHSIGDAIAQADDGTIIDISVDTYNENLVIDKDVTLRGGSEYLAWTVIRPAHGGDPVVHILPGTTVTLIQMEITGGFARPVGGQNTRQVGAPGITNEGILYADHVIVDDNNNHNGQGGGIYSTGPLHMQDSMVANNASWWDEPSSGDQGAGGGIYSERSLVTLDSTMVSDNSAYKLGGGIMLAGSSLVMSNSTIHGNSAGDGGGLYVGSPQQGGHELTPNVTIWRSTIDNNLAQGIGDVPESYLPFNGVGGGLFVGGANVVLKNVTLSGNTSFVPGGGIYAVGLQDTPASLMIVHGTIAENTSLYGEGGGIATSASAYGGFANITLQATILADNHGGNCLFHPDAVLESWGYNVFDDTSCSLHAYDQKNVDPKLNPLALNAPGNVKTHALQIGSPAIDYDQMCQVTEDARGVSRATVCDSGAYEGSEEPKASKLTVVVRQAATCRLGPGTQYAATGYLSAGETHEIIGRNEAGTWLRLEDCWVARTLLQVDVDVLSISVAAAPPLPTEPAAVCKPTMGPSECKAAGGKWVAGIPGVSKGSCNCP